MCRDMTPIMQNQIERTTWNGILVNRSMMQVFRVLRNIGECMCSVTNRGDHENHGCFGTFALRT